MKRCLYIMILVLLVALISCSSGQNEITGYVFDEKGTPLANAIVRIKATDLETASNAQGRFTLNVSNLASKPFFITAWASGYYINGVDLAQTGTSDLKIILTKHADQDNNDYEFLSAYSSAGKDGNCQNCHAEQGEAVSLPFNEWQQDAHALSAKNTRFLSMYLGQDLAGYQSPLTSYGYSRDYGSFPLRPDPTQPYYGPGYKLDFSDTAGNCAACHAPVAAIDDAYGADPTQLTGVETEGVACDFCHKIWDARLEPNSGLPYPNMPGVLSYEFRRPSDGHQFFAGPLDDVAPGEDTYSPIQRKSQYCAPCHFGVFWDTQIYNSFGEWLESPYSDPETGKTCQDCHMPPGKNDHFVRFDMGGVERNPSTIFSHRMPGASDEKLLQNAVTLFVSAHREDKQLVVNVTIVNDQTGHHIPTDSPLRHLILLVQAWGPKSEPLEQVDGPTVPEWGGVGNPSEGYYAGLPGKGYAKILMELWTEITPTGAYWNPTRIVSDNRLAAFGSDTSMYIFEAPKDGVRIEVALLFRRAFKDLMDQKGWKVLDIVMEDEVIVVP